VVVRDGHFFVGDERIRFWGVNIVRFHHLDHPAPAET
jgi:hypothetical protein